MKKVRNIAVIVLSVICVGILVFLLWNLRSTEESAQEIIPEVQPEPMSEQSVSDSDVSGNGAENSADPTELPETEESEPVETEDPVEQRAEELLAGMTLEEKVGQMFIARCPETDAASKVTQYHLGGYILFARDFTGKTKEEVTAAIQSYQNAAKVPLLIGVDEEGGTVNRVSKNANLRETPFASPQELYAQGGWDLIRSDTQEKCQLLQSLGINLNFAPVCDVSQDPQDFIYARSFGQDAEQTTEYVRTVVQTMSQEQMGSVLKHFPGYGNNSDTHTGIAYDERPIERFVNSDFLPFQAGLRQLAAAILIFSGSIAFYDTRLFARRAFRPGLAAALLLSGCAVGNMPQKTEAQEMTGQPSDMSGEGSMYMDTTENVIYLAGGCFWGMEQLMQSIPGVIDAESGYANGTCEADADYRTVCKGNTGFRETVRVEYDPGQVSLCLLYTSDAADD